MVSQRIERIIVWVALGIICLALSIGCFFLGKRVGASAAVPPILPKADTVYVKDTSTTTAGQKTEIPKGYELVPAGTMKVYDAVLNAYKDSLERKPKLVTIRDTSYIAVPMSEYKFTDNKTYEFAVNGYDVTFLWHKSFTQTAYITQPVPTPQPFRWTLYPEAGMYYGAGVAFAKVGIGADIGISKNLRWRVTPEAGYSATIVGKDLQHGFYGGIAIKFNLIQKY